MPSNPRIYRVFCGCNENVFHSLIHIIHNFHSVYFGISTLEIVLFVYINWRNIPRKQKSRPRHFIWKCPDGFAVCDYSSVVFSAAATSVTASTAVASLVSAAVASISSSASSASVSPAFAAFFTGFTFSLIQILEIRP